MQTTHAIDAISFLKKDHKVLRDLLSALEDTTERAAKKRRGILGQLGAAIRAHAKSEEEIFYPAFRKAAKTREDEQKFLEATEEHALVDVVLPDLEATKATSEVFGAKAKVLKDLIEHHAEEEEEEMFPRAKRLLAKDALAELGERLAARHAEILEAESKPRSR